MINTECFEFQYSTGKTGSWPIYQVLELPNDTTPEELKAVGRAKEVQGLKKIKINGRDHLVAGTHSMANCYYDEATRSYDTGFDKTSKEFIGMSDSQVKKILDSRKDLKTYYTRLLERSGMSEYEFLAQYDLPLYHGYIVNTDDIDTRLRLYFALRGNKLAPECEMKDKAKYPNTQYYLINIKDAEEKKMDNAAKQMKVIQTMMDKIKQDFNLAVAYYIHMNRGLKTSKFKDENVFASAFHNFIQKPENLEKAIYSFEKASDREIEINRIVLENMGIRLNRKKDGYYYFEDAKLGRNRKEIV